MRSLSVRDILKALPHFKNEIDIINPANDVEVFAVLDAVGFDSRQGIKYIVANHRDMAKQDGVGYIATGEYNPDRKFNKFITVEDMIVIAGMTDISLGKELALLSGKKFVYKNEDEYDIGPKKRKPDPRYYSDEQLLEMGFTEGNDEEEYDDVDNSYEAITAQIETLQGVLDVVRKGV